jgi:type IV secretory pathway VirJ component
MKYISVFFYNVILIYCLSSQILLSAQNIQVSKQLPILEFKSAGKSDFYVILFTGNGGWRKLVQAVTLYLNSNNISVLVVNSEKYFRSEKTPAQITEDLESLIDCYTIKWSEDKVCLIGYSMGAEIIPFAANSLDKRYSEKIRNIILIAPWQKATFKDKLIYHIFEIDKGVDLYAEISKMNGKNIFIICDDTKNSICLKGLDENIDHEKLYGGHHFGGDYTTLSKLIGKRLKLE